VCYPCVVTINDDDDDDDKKSRQNAKRVISLAMGKKQKDLNDS